MGNPKDYVVVGWDTEKGQQIEAIAIKKLAVDGHPSTGATVRMQYQGHIWKGQILSFHGFVMREKANSCPSPSAIKFALRNKLSAMESRKTRKN